MNKGFSVLGVLLFIAFFLLAVFGLDYAFVEYYRKCGDIPLQECLTQNPEKPAEAAKEEVVIATGDFSYKKYSIHISMNIPLGNGSITGQVTGTCKATIKGNYENGNINGKAFGSCNPFVIPVPAKATFTGRVNQAAKTVPITGHGSTVGIAKEGSLTLTYK